MRYAYGRKWVSRALALSFLTFSVASCDFVSPTEVDPNAVPEASIDQLFTGVQVNSFFINQSNVPRVTNIWLNQLAGTDRQAVDFDNFRINEETADDPFDALYTGGGLIDLRTAIAAAEDGRRAYAGILKVYEAWLFGMAASLWGAIPYSEAANPEITEPRLDDQLSVYSAMQSLLDEAIADLGTGAGAPGSVDLNFGGSTTAWIAVAHSMKARYHMHLAELEGSSRYQAALSEAQQGISSVSGNWLSVHTSSSTENNFFYQYWRDRDSYIRVGALIVNLMQDRSDPRIPLYFTEASGDFAGTFIGSPPGTPAGDPEQAASNPNVPIEPTFDQPFITCAETQFIAAEASYALGNEGSANSFLQAGIACQEANWGVDIPDPGTLSGQALFEEIMVQKYIASFLSWEPWNDYKRTCLPELIPHPNGQSPPQRMFYSESERQNNSNIPAANAAGNDLSGNDNDPSSC